jgi:prepilin-type N-terminal cleavage/methylation domain-containing protein
MKTPRPQQPARARAFSLLEMIIVLAITALVITAVYSLAQGTLTLADDVGRADRRDTRKQAFTTFCEHLFTSLPPNAALNLKTTQSGGEYLTQLELQNISSPFDGTPNCIVTLYTQGMAGGGMRLIISSQPISTNPLEKKDAKNAYHVVLFEDLLQCEWRVFIPAAQQWATVWTEDTNLATSTPNPAAPITNQHPPLLELVMNQAGDESRRQVFWIAPSQALTLTQPGGVVPGQVAPGQVPGQPQVAVPGQTKDGQPAVPSSILPTR